MERWTGRVALVTGTSAGIGATVAEELVKKGLKVVGVARRVEIVEKLWNDLQGEKGKLYPLKADVGKEEDILSTFEWIKKNLGGVDVVINNAFASEDNLLSEISTESFRKVFEVNVIGSSICAREAIKSMRERGVDDGHIININSIAGHSIQSWGNTCPYAASKHSLRVITEGLRRELVQQKSKIRVTSVSPGVVNTEAIQKVREKFPTDLPMLDTQDIADAILYVLSAPPHVQVCELMIRPVGENF